MLIWLLYSEITPQLVQKWAAEFRKGRECLEDDPGSGHPANVTTKKNIDHVHHMVMVGRQLTINKIANTISEIANTISIYPVRDLEYSAQ